MWYVADVFSTARSRRDIHSGGAFVALGGIYHGVFLNQRPVIWGGPILYGMAKKNRKHPIEFDDFADFPSYAMPEPLLAVDERCRFHRPYPKHFSHHIIIPVFKCFYQTILDAKNIEKLVIQHISSRIPSLSSAPNSKVQKDRNVKSGSQ